MLMLRNTAPQREHFLLRNILSMDMLQELMIP